MSQIITEATRPYEEKIIDPALMTYHEYRDMADPDHKSHPSDAYDVNIEELNRYGAPEDYQKLINTITRHGRKFELRQSVKDRWDGKYVKTNSDGDIVYGDDGLAAYMDADDIKKMIPEEKRFSYEYAVIDPEIDKIVGNTQDEWGTLLVRVAAEYRQFGFGTLLVKLARTDRPDRPSGGFTNAGVNNFARVHDEMVREYMASGFYSHLVRTGQITAARVKEITGTLKPRKTHKPKNLNTSDPSDWMLMSDGSSYALLYDRKIYEIEDYDSENGQFWSEKFVIGFASIASMGGPSVPWVNRTYGTDKIKAYLIEVLLNQEIGNSIRMEPEELAIIQQNKRVKLQTMRGKQVGDAPSYFIDHPTVAWQQAANAERRYRKQRDPHDEIYTRLLTWGEQLGER